MNEKERKNSNSKASDVIANGKKYTIEVGIDRPYVGGDDVFDIEMTLFQDEIDTLIDEGKKQLWIDNDLEPWEYLEWFLPEAYKRANKLAEEYAVAEWGDKMFVENGAQYNFFLPSEIEFSIYESDECKKLENLIGEIQERSRNRFYEDEKCLFGENEKGRWRDCLLDDPQWNNSKFGGIWYGGPKSLFGFHTNLMIDGNKINFRYSQKYLLDSVELELRLYPTKEKLQTIIERIVLKHGYKITKHLLLDYPPVKEWVLYANKEMDDSGVEIFVESLDEFVKMD